MLKEDFYSSCILKMSGCGACTLKNNIFAYGDLSGNITISVLFLSYIKNKAYANF